MSLRRTAEVCPSAYFWTRVSFVSALALFAAIAVSIVVVTVFDSGWGALACGVCAFSAWIGNAASFVQTPLELRQGYTTLPWLAYEVELRDPRDGHVLVPATRAHPPFTTLKAARAFASTAASGGPVPVQPATDRGASAHDAGVVVVRTHAPIIRPALVGLTLLAIGVMGGLLCAVVLLIPKVPVVLFPLVPVFGLAVVAIIFAYPTYLDNQGATDRLNALAKSFPRASLLAVRPTVELYGELGQPAALAITPALILLRDDDEVALWSGTRELTKIFSKPSHEVQNVHAASAHNLRANEFSALRVSFQDDSHFLFFAKRSGAKSLWSLTAEDTGLAIERFAGQP